MAGYNNVLPARAGVAYAVQVGGKDNGNAAAMDMYDVGVANSRFADA